MGYYPLDAGEEGAPREFLRCAPWIEAALEYSGGTHVLGDIARGVAEGSMTLFPGENSAAVVELHEYPRLSAAHVFLAGGEMDELVEGILPAIEEWAHSLGVDRVTLAGRKGWERVLRDRYRPAWVTLTREL